MKIRKYNDNLDRKKVLDLLRFNTPFYFAEEEEVDLNYYFDNHADNYYVMEEEEIIVGSGGFNLSEDGGTGKISWDIVHPLWQKKGIGSALTKYRIAKMKEIAGVHTISVRTSQHVYLFYEKFGLQLKEIVKDYWAEGFDLYRLDCDVDKTIIDW